MGDKALDGFDGFVDGLVDDRFFGRFPLPEDEVNLATFGEVVADAETETAEGVGAKFFDDVGEAVMTAVGSLFAEADSAQGKGDVVVDDEEVFDGDFFLAQPILHGFAAKVHIGGWFDDKEGPAPVFHFRGLGETTRGERGFEVFCQAVGDPEACVVTGVFIFRADVSETGNQIFHGVVYNVETVHAPSLQGL